ncbi:uncharacterized protein LOC141857818 isoform X2 [Brevipalpus obovatus]
MESFIVNQFHKAENAETNQENFIEVVGSSLIKNDRRVWKSVGEIDITVEMLNEMLLRTIKVLSRPKNIKNDRITKEDLKRFLNISQVESKAVKGVFKSPGELYEDLKSLKLFMESSGVSVSRAIKNLVKDVKKVTKKIERCAYCSYNCFFGPRTLDWFVEPCQPAHLLVLAPRYGIKKWPAKLMDYDAVSQRVLVTFFGSFFHPSSWIKASDCFIFHATEVLQNNCIPEDIAAEYESSLEELSEHLAALSRRSVEYQLPTIPTRWKSCHGIYMKVFSCIESSINSSESDSDAETREIPQIRATQVRLRLLERSLKKCTIPVIKGKHKSQLMEKVIRL